MIFVIFFHPSRTDAAALQILFFPLYADVRKFPKLAARVAASVFFFLGIPSKSLALLRKFLEILVLFVPHTREFLRRELEHVSRPGGGGAANLLGRLPPPFSFFGVSFSAGQSRSFRRASSTACARK